MFFIVERDYTERDFLTEENKIIFKRYPYGGKCSKCFQESDNLYVWNETICADCYRYLKERGSKVSLHNTNFAEQRCNMCGNDYKYSTVFNWVTLWICKSCIKKIGHKDKLSGYKKLF